jgi:hypothetical protein
MRYNLHRDRQQVGFFTAIGAMGLFSKGVLNTTSDLARNGTPL